LSIDERLKREEERTERITKSQFENIERFLKYDIVKLAKGLKEIAENPKNKQDNWTYIGKVWDQFIDKFKIHESNNADLLKFFTRMNIVDVVGKRRGLPSMGDNPLNYRDFNNKWEMGVYPSMASVWNARAEEYGLIKKPSTQKPKKNSKAKDRLKLSKDDYQKKYNDIKMPYRRNNDILREIEKIDKEVREYDEIEGPYLEASNESAWDELTEEERNQDEYPDKYHDRRGEIRENMIMEAINEKILKIEDRESPDPDYWRDLVRHNQRLFKEGKRAQSLKEKQKPSSKKPNLSELKEKLDKHESSKTRYLGGEDYKKWYKEKRSLMGKIERMKKKTGEKYSNKEFQEIFDKFEKGTYHDTLDEIGGILDPKYTVAQLGKLRKLERKQYFAPVKEIPLDEKINSLKTHNKILVNFIQDQKDGSKTEGKLINQYKTVQKEIEKLEKKRRQRPKTENQLKQEKAIERAKSRKRIQGYDEDLVDINQDISKLNRKEAFDLLGKISDESQAMRDLSNDEYKNKRTENWQEYRRREEILSEFQQKVSNRTSDIYKEEQLKEKFMKKLEFEVNISDMNKEDIPKAIKELKAKFKDTDFSKYNKEELMKYDPNTAWNKNWNLIEKTLVKYEDKKLLPSNQIEKIKEKMNKINKMEGYRAFFLSKDGKSVKYQPRRSYTGDDASAVTKMKDMKEVERIFMNNSVAYRQSKEKEPIKQKIEIKKKELEKKKMRQVNLSKEEHEILEEIWDQGRDTKEIARIFKIPVKEAYQKIKKLQKKVGIFESVDQDSEGILDYNVKKTTKKVNSLFWQPDNLDETLEDYLKENNYKINISEPKKKEEIKMSEKKKKTFEEKLAESNKKAIKEELNQRDKDRLKRNEEQFIKDYKEKIHQKRLERDRKKYKIGDEVQLKGTDSKGKITSFDGKWASLEMWDKQGNFSTGEFDLNDLEKTKDKSADAKLIKSANSQMKKILDKRSKKLNEEYEQMMKEDAESYDRLKDRIKESKSKVLPKEKPKKKTKTKDFKSIQQITSEIAELSKSIAQKKAKKEAYTKERNRRAYLYKQRKKFQPTTEDKVNAGLDGVKVKELPKGTIESLTKDQLKKWGNKFKIQNYSKMDKSHLLEKIKNKHQEALQYIDGDAFNLGMSFRFGSKEELKKWYNEKTEGDYSDLEDVGKLDYEGGTIFAPDESLGDFATIFHLGKYDEPEITFETKWGVKESESLDNPLDLLQIYSEGIKEFEQIFYDKKIPYNVQWDKIHEKEKVKELPKKFDKFDKIKLKIGVLEDTKKESDLIKRAKYLIMNAKSTLPAGNRSILKNAIKHEGMEKGTSDLDYYVPRFEKKHEQIKKQQDKEKAKRDKIWKEKESLEDLSQKVGKLSLDLDYEKGKKKPNSLQIKKMEKEKASLLKKSMAQAKKEDKEIVKSPESLNQELLKFGEKEGGPDTQIIINAGNKTYSYSPFERKIREKTGDATTSIKTYSVYDLWDIGIRDIKAWSLESDGKIRRPTRETASLKTTSMEQLRVKKKRVFKAKVEREREERIKETAKKERAKKKEKERRKKIEEMPKEEQEMWLKKFEDIKKEAKVKLKERSKIFEPVIKTPLDNKLKALEKELKSNEEYLKGEKSKPIITNTKEKIEKLKSEIVKVQAKKDSYIKNAKLIKSGKQKTIGQFAKEKPPKKEPEKEKELSPKHLLEISELKRIPTNNLLQLLSNIAKNKEEIIDPNLQYDKTIIFEFPEYRIDYLSGKNANGKNITKFLRDGEKINKRQIVLALKQYGLFPKLKKKEPVKSSLKVEKPETLDEMYERWDEEAESDQNIANIPIRRKNKEEEAKKKREADREKRSQEMRDKFKQKKKDKWDAKKEEIQRQISEIETKRMKEKLTKEEEKALPEKYEEIRKIYKNDPKEKKMRKAVKKMDKEVEKKQKQKEKELEEYIKKRTERIKARQLKHLKSDEDYLKKTEEKIKEKGTASYEAEVEAPALRMRIQEYKEKLGMKLDPDYIEYKKDQKQKNIDKMIGRNDLNDLVRKKEKFEGNLKSQGIEPSKDSAYNLLQDSIIAKKKQLVEKKQRHKERIKLKKLDQKQLEERSKKERMEKAPKEKTGKDYAKDRIERKDLERRARLSLSGKLPKLDDPQKEFEQLKQVYEKVISDEIADVKGVMTKGEIQGIGMKLENYSNQTYRQMRKLGKQGIDVKDYTDKIRHNQKEFKKKREAVSLDVNRYGGYSGSQFKENIHTTLKPKLKSPTIQGAKVTQKPDRIRIKSDEGFKQKKIKIKKRPRKEAKSLRKQLKESLSESKKAQERQKERKERIQSKEKVKKEEPKPEPIKEKPTPEPEPVKEQPKQDETEDLIGKLAKQLGTTPEELRAKIMPEKKPEPESPKEEMKEEIKEEIKEEVKAEVMQEVKAEKEKEELKEDVKKEVMEEVKAEIKPESLKEKPKAEPKPEEKQPEPKKELPKEQKEETGYESLSTEELDEKIKKLKAEREQMSNVGLKGKVNEYKKKRGEPEEEIKKTGKIWVKPTAKKKGYYRRRPQRA